MSKVDAKKRLAVTTTAKSVTQKQSVAVLTSVLGETRRKSLSQAESADGLRVKCKECTRTYSCLTSFRAHVCRPITAPSSTLALIEDVTVLSNGRLKCTRCQHDYKNRACFTHHRRRLCLSTETMPQQRKRKVESDVDKDALDTNISTATKKPRVSANAVSTQQQAMQVLRKLLDVIQEDPDGIKAAASYLGSSSTNTS